MRRCAAQIGAAGRAFVEREYRWQDNAALMERLYEEMVAWSAWFVGRSSRFVVGVEHWCADGDEWGIAYASWVIESAMIGAVAASDGGPMQTAETHQVEDSARLLIPALETIEKNRIPESRDAQRYAMRLRFAIARVEELRASCERHGGVFEPARLEVAISILQTHQRRATAFVSTFAQPSRAAASTSYRTRDEMADVELKAA